MGTTFDNRTPREKREQETFLKKMREDAAKLSCSNCGRNSYGGEYENAVCNMPQPDKTICKGKLKA